MLDSNFEGDDLGPSIEGSVAYSVQTGQKALHSYPQAPLAGIVIWILIFVSTQVRGLDSSLGTITKTPALTHSTGPKIFGRFSG